MNESNGKPTLSTYDKISGQLLAKSPDRFATKQSTAVTLTPLLNQSQTWIVQTIREREARPEWPAGDYILLQYLGSDGTFQVVLPPKVADLIIRQRDALSGKIRRHAGKERAARDKREGKLPGFMRNPGKRKAKKSKKSAAPAAE